MISNRMTIRFSGFTLMEAAIVASLFGLIMAAMNSLLFSGVNLYSDSVLQQDLYGKLSILSNEIQKNLNNASMIRSVDNAQGSWVEFQVPTKNLAGDYLDATGVPNWGDGSDLYNRLILQFEPEELVSEAVLKRDINLDGDQTDFFSRGILTLKRYSEGHIVELMGPLPPATSAAELIDTKKLQ